MYIWVVQILHKALKDVIFCLPNFISSFSTKQIWLAENLLQICGQICGILKLSEIHSRNSCSDQRWQLARTSKLELETYQCSVSDKVLWSWKLVWWFVSQRHTSKEQNENSKAISMIEEEQKGSRKKLMIRWFQWKMKTSLLSLYLKTENQAKYMADLVVLIAWLKNPIDIEKLENHRHLMLQKDLNL